MANNYARRATVSAKQARRMNDPNITGAARDGFIDAQAGKPYRPEYETAPRQYQGNYETGRLMFFYAKQAGMSDRALNWPAQTIMPRFVETLAPIVVQDLKPLREGA